MMLRTAVAVAVLAGILCAVYLLLTPTEQSAPAQPEIPPAQPEIAPAPSESTGFTLSRETTFFTEPLLPDDSVDYAAAINQQLSRGVTPENNACVPLFRAFGPTPDGTTMPEKFWELLGMEPPPADGIYFVSLDEFAERLSLSDEQLSQLKVREKSARAGTWSRKEFPLLARWIDANEIPIRLVRAAVQRERYFTPLVPVNQETGERTPLLSVRLPGPQRSWWAAQLLSARAMLQVSEGDFSAAWNDLIACRRLGRHVGSGPTMIEKLVGYSAEALALNNQLTILRATRTKAALIEEYISDIEALPPLPAMKDTVNLFERCACLDLLLMLRRGREAEVKQIDLGVDLAQLVRSIQRYDPEVLDWNTPLKLCNGWYDRLVADMTLPTWAEKKSGLEQTFREFDQIRARAKLRSLLALHGPTEEGRRHDFAVLVGEIVTSLVMPNATAGTRAEMRTRQRTDNVRSALALAAYRSDHDSYPDSLEQLVPAYLPETPLDIFTGKQPIYRASEDGYLLYSVGENMQDEEGRSFFDEPVGDDLPVNMLPWR